MYLSSFNTVSSSNDEYIFSNKLHVVIRKQDPVTRSISMQQMEGGNGEERRTMYVCVYVCVCMYVCVYTYV